MKTILVLTDFSESSVNAYRYAVQLACQVKANILLVFSTNGNTISLTNQMQYSQMLHSFAKRYACDSRSKSYSNVTECLISGDRWVDAIPLLIQVHQPDLVIAGSELLTLIQDKEEALALQHFQTCPIIWVPKKASYQPLKNLVFVTDFTDQDPAIIDQMKELARQFKASISVVHFYTSTDRNRLTEIKREGAALHRFLNDVDAHYFLIEEEDMIEGLQEFTEKNPVDLFLFGTKDTHLANYYFKPDYQKTLACQTAIPLLNLYQDKKKACAGTCGHCLSTIEEKQLQFLSNLNQKNESQTVTN